MLYLGNVKHERRTGRKGPSGRLLEVMQVGFGVWGGGGSFCLG